MQVDLTGANFCEKLNFQTIVIHVSVNHNLCINIYFFYNSFASILQRLISFAKYFIYYQNILYTITFAKLVCANFKMRKYLIRCRVLASVL
jgi:hypothetical protein